MPFFSLAIALRHIIIFSRSLGARMPYEALTPSEIRFVRPMVGGGEKRRGNTNAMEAEKRGYQWYVDTTLEVGGCLLTRHRPQ
eukprot:3505788-Prymnesium_polylepis.1